MLTFRRIPSDIKSWGSMKATKCDHALDGNRTFRSGVGAKNEGKYDLFAEIKILTWLYNLPKLSQKVKEMKVFKFSV